MNQQNFCSSCYTTCPLSISYKKKEKAEGRDLRVFFGDNKNSWNLLILIQSYYNVEDVNKDNYEDFTMITCTPTEDCPATQLTPFCFACAQRQSVLRDILKTWSNHIKNNDQE